MPKHTRTGKYYCYFLDSFTRYPNQIFNFFCVSAIRFLNYNLTFNNQIVVKRHKGFFYFGNYQSDNMF